MTLWASLQTGSLAEKVMHEKLPGFHLQWSHLQTQMDHNIGSKADTGDLITKSNTDSSVVQALDDQIMSVFAEHLKSGTKKTQQCSVLAGRMGKIFLPTDPEPVACFIVPLSGW